MRTTPLSELKSTEVKVGMRVISARGREGVICEIEYDGRMGADDPTIWMKWEGGAVSAWWLSGLSAVKVVSE